MKTSVPTLRFFDLGSFSPQEVPCILSVFVFEGNEKCVGRSFVWLLCCRHLSFLWMWSQQWRWGLIATLEWAIWRSVIVVRHVDARHQFEMKLVGILNATMNISPPQEEKLVEFLIVCNVWGTIRTSTWKKTNGFAFIIHHFGICCPTKALWEHLLSGFGDLRIKSWLNG